MYTTYCTQMVHASKVSVSESQIPLKSMLFHPWNAWYADCVADIGTSSNQGLDSAATI